MFDPAGLEVCQLSNKLTVIYQPLPTIVTVADVWVGAGSALEDDRSRGVAHLLEHMIFRGTANIPPGVFDRLIENQGGVTNAATSYDYTHFFVATGVEQFQPCLAALGELMVQASLCPQELEGERQVVLAEINQILDNPSATSWQEFNQSLYAAHPYGQSVLGTIEQVQALSNAELRAFHRRYYQPDNMTIVVAGGIPKDHCLDWIEDAFQGFGSPLDLPSSLANDSDLPMAPEPAPPLEARRSEIQLPQLDHTSLMLGWATPAIAQLRDICGLELLSVILTGGRLARLVQILREQRCVVQDVTSELEVRRAASRFMIHAWLEEPYLAMVESLILHELQRLCQDPVDDRELHRAKRLLINDMTFSLETPLQIASLYGFYNILQDPYVPLAYPQTLEQLTPQDLLDIAQRYLTDSNYVVTIARPA